jgi:RNA polymerase sigma factor (sigma-70 family)
VSDIEEEVLWTIMTNVHRYNPARCKFTTWAFGVCQNASKHYFRSEKKHSNVLKFEDMAKRSPDPEQDTAEWVQALSVDDKVFEALHSIDNIVTINHIVKGMSDRHYQVYILRFHKNKTLKQIAQIMGRGTTRIVTMVQEIKKAIIAAMPEYDSDCSN